MASEITATGSLSYLNPTSGISVAQALGTIPSISIAIAGKGCISRTQTIPTTVGGTALDVSGLSTLGWFIIFNRDPTNYVQIMNAVSGTIFPRILPGEFVMGRFDSSVTAPAAIANSASVFIQYVILEA